jgi:hypothetical protein
MSITFYGTAYLLEYCTSTQHNKPCCQQLNVKSQQYSAVLIVFTTTLEYSAVNCKITVQ